MTEETQIKILSFDLMNGSTPLKALCNLQIGNVQVRGVRLVQKEGCTARISMPASKRYEPGDRMTYVPIVVITNETLRIKIERTVLTEFERRRSSKSA